MRILVVGAGSVGGYFGGRLAQIGRDITFLVRPARALQLRERGLQILSPHGNFTLSPRLVTSDEIAGPFDVVLLSVKAYALESAIEDLAPAVGNAIFNAVGARVRSLPITAEAVKAAMKA